jgi:Tfp pilus assembly protein PilN
VEPVNELVSLHRSLPDKIEDVARFLLIAPEKAQALRAEIRAIQNLKLAKEVYDQKLSEQRRLQELILDASVKMGEFTRALPKVEGGDRKSEKYQHDSGVGLIQSKTETIRNLGFSPKQVERFETLAGNKDLVEQVKAEAREAGAVPTRTKVLNLAQERTRIEIEAFEQTDRDLAAMRRFLKLINAAPLDEIDDELIAAVVRVSDPFESLLSLIDTHIGLITKIRNKLVAERRKYDGKANH